MKSDKGIAMLSLVVYVASFLVVTTLVGTISTYFYNNMDLVNTAVGGTAEYNKLNLYIVKHTKDANLKNVNIAKQENLDNESDNEDAIVFYTDIGKNLIIRKGNYLYYNNTILCSAIESFTPTIEYKNGKEILIVNVKMSGSSFTTRYVIG